MHSHPNQQPNEQADGHAGALKDDARGMINNARQILEGHRQRAIMAMGRDAFEGVWALLTLAIADIDREREARREILRLATPRSPDPAHIDALVEMEKTNRELGLTGDALTAHLQTEGLDR